MSYNASINVVCLKQHTCVACNSKYSYVLERNVTAQGSTEAQATDNANEMAAKTIANHVDFFPCPQCGTVQPEMTAEVKSMWAWIGIVVGVIFLITTLICAASQGMTIAFSSWLAVFGALISLACFAYSALYNPNKDVMSNQHTAQQAVHEQKISLDETAATAGPPMDEHGGMTGGQLIGLVMGVAALLLAFAPNGLRILNG
jgi:hypothetical protein